MHHEGTNLYYSGFRAKWLLHQLSIFHPHNIFLSGLPEKKDSGTPSGNLGILRLLNFSPSEGHYFARASFVEKWLFSRKKRREIFPPKLEEEDEWEPASWQAVKRLLAVPLRKDLEMLRVKRAAEKINDSSWVYEALALNPSDRLLEMASLLRASRGFTFPVLAPPVSSSFIPLYFPILSGIFPSISPHKLYFLYFFVLQVEVWCSDRSFTYQQTEHLKNPLALKLILGFARTSPESGPYMPESDPPLIEELEKVGEIKPLMETPFRVFGSSPFVKFTDFAKMLTVSSVDFALIPHPKSQLKSLTRVFFQDSGKLHTLDRLLRKLRMEGHRVLVFAQMTKVLNILEVWKLFDFPLEKENNKRRELGL